MFLRGAYSYLEERQRNPKLKIPSSKEDKYQIQKTKFQILISKPFEICPPAGGLLFVISSARFLYTILATASILLIGVFGLLHWRRMWFPENLNKQVAELSDAVWRISGPPKKFYVADVPPPLPIFYSGLKVTTVTEDGAVGALSNQNVAILSKKGTYRDVLEKITEEGKTSPIMFKETEDYVLYGY